jgi:uncharacterized membrane protein YhaH (DUF805 family)
MHLLAMLLQENQPSPEMIQHMVVAMMAIIPIIIIIAIAVVMIPCWFILKKAGFSPWLSLLCLIPSLGTLVLLYVLAFADWKVIPAPMAAYPPPYPPPPPPPPYTPQA